MSIYNWKREWWVDGMSMLCFTHHFCKSNVTTSAQFRRFFGPKKRGSLRPGQILQADQSLLDAGKILSGVGVSRGKWDTLFPSRYSVTDETSELIENLVHCPTCIEKGLHLSAHQMSWMHRCPIHDEELRWQCVCKSSTRYSLVDRKSSSDALCKCGRLKFGPYSALNSEETADLKRFESKISRIQRRSRFGVTQLRLSYGKLTCEEMRTQFSGATQLLAAIANKKGTRARSHGLRSFRIDLAETDVNQEICEWFGRFREFAGKHAYSNARLHSMGFVASALYDEFFGEYGLKRMANCLTANGGSKPVRSCDIDAGLVVFAIRLLEGLGELRAPVRSPLNPDVKMAMRMHGEPLCMIVWENESRDKGRAYWLPDPIDSPQIESPWTQHLARLLLLSVFNDGRNSTQATGLFYKAMASSEPDLFGISMNPTRKRRKRRIFSLSD